MTNQSIQFSIKSIQDYVLKKLMPDENEKLLKISTLEFREPNHQIIYWLYQIYGSPNYNLETFIENLKKCSKEQYRSYTLQSLMHVKKIIEESNLSPFQESCIELTMRIHIREIVSLASQKYNISFVRALQIPIAEYLQVEVPTPKIKTNIIYQNSVGFWLTKKLGFSEHDCETLKKDAKINFRKFYRHYEWIIFKHYEHLLEELLKQNNN